MDEKILVTYKPLRHTLIEKDTNISTVCEELDISSTLRRKLNKDKDYVSLVTIVKICRHLDVPIEKVVEVIRD